MGDYVYKQEQNYVQYNNLAEVKDLDRNVWNSAYGVIADGATGRHLYKNEPRHPAYNVCFSGRDPETHYIIGVDRDEHPDHSSRFGYARCMFGYCSGHWPGRYIEAEACSEYDPQPPRMAPERFYTAEHQGPFNVRSQAIEDYNFTKNIGMNYPSWYSYKGEPKDRL